MIDWKKMYNKLARTKPGSWRALSRETGIPPATFTRLKSGKTLSAGHYFTLLGYLGLTSDDLRKRSNAQRATR